MITEQAVVQDIRENIAVVKVERSEACGNCAARGMCQALGGQSKEMLVEVLNDKHAKPGDVVEISIPSKPFLKSMSVVYMIPVMSLIAGLFLGMEFGKRTDIINPSLAGFLGAMIFLAGAFGFARWYDRKAQQNIEYWPRISRVILPSGLESTGENQ